MCSKNSLAVPIATVKDIHAEIFGKTASRCCHREEVPPHLYKEAVHEEGWTANSQNDAGARFFIAAKRVFREIIIAKTLSMRPYKKSL
ncbi:MAG: hypothetical protein HDR52_09305 [Treponema sp.]|nr:hypothetical protein [Treponema sp.]